MEMRVLTRTKGRGKLYFAPEQLDVIYADESANCSVVCFKSGLVWEVVESPEEIFVIASVEVKK